MPPIGLLFKFRDIGYLFVIISLGGWIGWLKYDAAQVEVRQLAAIAKANEQAKKLSDELIEAQAAALSATNTKAVTYVDRIRYVKTPDNSCPADERMRIGSVGVRDIVGGRVPKAGGGATDTVRSTVVGP